LNNSNATIRYIELRNLLNPYCKQIKPAGDLRRHCRDVERIELLAIPKVIGFDPLFGNQVMPYPLIEDWVLNSELYFSINTPFSARNVARLNIAHLLHIPSVRCSGLIQSISIA